MKLNTTKIKQNIIKNISLYIAVIAMVVGVILAVNFNEKLPRIISPTSSIVALREMQNNLEKENEVYKDELAEIETAISALQDKTKDKQTDLKGLVADVEKKKAEAGLTEVVGEGIVVVLNDSEQRKTNPNSIAHASDMRDLVNHFFQNGAKAISIEGAGEKEERVSFFTSIDCIINTVLINETKIVPPFKIRVLGDRDRMITAVNDRVALKQIYDRVDKEGLEFHTIDGQAVVTLTKYSGPTEIKNAKLK